MADATPSDAAPTTAVEAAVVKNDFPAFEAAERAALAGTPLPAPVAETEPDPDPDPDPKPAAVPVLSKRQQDINDRIKRATDAVAAAKDAEIADLRAKLTTVPPTKPAEKPAEAPKPETFPTFAQFVDKQPEATLEDWLNARDDWRDTQRERAQAARADRQTVEQVEQDRMSKASEAIQAKAADPEWVKRLHPRLLQIETFADAGRNGRPTGPGNVVAEELFKSEQLVPLLEHFSAHPEALAALETMPAHIQALPPRLRVAEHARWIVREMGKIEASLAPATAAPESTPKPKTVSRAPAPPADLGKRQTDAADPTASAVAANDYAAFEAAERAKLAAQMRR